MSHSRSTGRWRDLEHANLSQCPSGNDRQQWFPVAVSMAMGAMSVMYYDQGIGTSNDLTEDDVAVLR